MPTEMRGHDSDHLYNIFRYAQELYLLYRDSIFSDIQLFQKNGSNLLQHVEFVIQDPGNLLVEFKQKTIERS